MFTTECDRRMLSANFIFMRQVPALMCERLTASPRDHSQFRHSVGLLCSRPAMPDNSFVQLLSILLQQCKTSKDRKGKLGVILQCSRFCTCKYPERLWKEDSTSQTHVAVTLISHLCDTVVYVTLTFKLTASALHHVSLPAITLRSDICYHMSLSQKMATASFCQ